jgi:hypothetical protein
VGVFEAPRTQHEVFPPLRESSEFGMVVLIRVNLALGMTLIRSGVYPNRLQRKNSQADSEAGSFTSHWDQL